ncbi:uncharacterized protein LOC114523408 [Dendronephthya gigantea]|uniref:uncharacterized protein LOC114523408 n=1 Tax=Dendronephthya gigantea TaxID=151771 RepID=UPI00106B790E|nr:uncharacterized protein LOC114523408 [Dendronephthya gigantea]
MAEELMNRLINAVDNLREGSQLRNQNNNNNNQELRGNGQTIENTMRRLYPSTDSDRSYVPSVRNFEPSTNYRPKKGKKNLGKKRKQIDNSADKGNSNKEKPVLRDVILLPSPKIVDVPRGLKREKLYTQGCCISAFEICDSHSEKEIRNKMITAFGEKLKGLPDPKFKFVRAVGNKIVDPSCETYTGKVLKYLNKQGPIYVRAVSAIFQEDLSNPWSDDDSSIADQVEDLPLESSDDEVLLVHAFQQSKKDNTKAKVHDSDQGEASTSGVTAKKSKCPTCYRSFPLTEIAEHADTCAELADGFSSSRQTYGDLLMEFPCDDIIDVDAETSCVAEEVPKNDQINLQECLEALQKNIHEARSTIYVRRKLLWEDYVDANNHNKWFNPQNSLKVNFIGEKAVDGGGPKREFFCETMKQMEIRLFSDGIPVKSTMALTEGHFKVAGLLMASSVLQGGPAPNFLANWVYQFISGGLDAVTIQVNDVKRDSLKVAVEKIAIATSDSELQEILLGDEVMAELDRIGYRRIPTRESVKNKENLIRCICVNEAVVPKIPMLNQLGEGLEQYGLLHEIRKYPELFKPIFTANSSFDITADDLIQRLVVHFSEQQLLKSKEQDIFKYFTDFIQTLYYEGICEAPDLKLKDVLKFITGCESIPPIGFPCSLNVHFRHDCPSGCKCRPTASTCALVIILPIHSCSSQELGDLLISALCDCCGFGNL